MGYHGGSLVSLFNARPQKATDLCARRLADRAGEQMVQRTRENTPIDTGELRASWYQLPTNKTHFAIWPAYESGVASNVDYAPYVEYGTRPHIIEPKKPGGVLHWVDPGSGEDVFARRVHHPGTAGQHMIAIGAAMTEFEIDSGAVVKDILDEWVSEVERSAD